MYDPRNVLIVILLTLCVGLSLSTRSYRNDLITLKETVAAEKAVAAAEHDRIEKEQASVAADTAAGWAAAVAYWREHGGVRVRPAAAQGAVPAVSGSAAGAAGLRPGEQRPRAAVDVDAAECEARLNGSVLDAVWIETVKGWVKRQRAASEPIK